MQKNLLNRTTTLLLGVVLSLSVAQVTGCGVGTAPVVASIPSSPITTSAVGMRGNAHGGQQPVSGATIQMYAAGSTGYGSSYAYPVGTSLLGTTVVKTDQYGNFSIPQGSYTCPSATTEIYMTATGGNPGMAATVANPNPSNPNLALVASLGPCGALSPSTFVNINELSTVAFVWALSPFMTGPTAVGTSVNNTGGLTNAFSTVQNLVSTATGQVVGSSLPPGATIPVAKINSLADILANCINSAGGSAGDSSPCGQLFTNTTVNNVVPSNTITAAMNMAQHPHQNVAVLTNSVSSAAPFQPTLAAPPNDLNIVVSYSSGNLSTPRSLTIDVAGNIWAPNAGNNTLTEMTGTGTLLSGNLGYAVGSLNVPTAIATDQSGSAWIANSGNATVSKISAGGASATVYTVGANPSGVAVDAYGTVFVANAGGPSISRINTSGAVTTTTTTGTSVPVAIAINPK